MKTKEKPSLTSDQWTLTDQTTIEKDFWTGIERVEESVSVSVQESMWQFEEWITSHEICASLLD